MTYIKDKIEYWHNHPEIPEPLHEFLEMTYDEYLDFIQQDGAQL